MLGPRASQTDAVTHSDTAGAAVQGRYSRRVLPNARDRQASEAAQHAAELRRHFAEVDAGLSSSAPRSQLHSAA